MQMMRKAILATTIAAGFIANAHAAATIQTLDITWYKDGQVITKAQHIVDDGMSQTPYLQQSGKEVGYANCTGSAGAMRLSAEKMFVGRSLFINPVSANAGKVRLSVSVTDTALDGIHTTGAAECTSEVVDVHGYTAANIPVELTDGQTVEVPLKNPQYRLVLRLSRETL